jgi:Uma2 family endonuclease
MSQAANTINSAISATEIVYPDSDGRPMADNTKQYQYIITIQVGLDSLFASDPNVFVAADLFWYPVEGRPDIRTAPDVMVVFGRPKGHRGSYKQWVEGGIAPQVVFEILSPGNTWREMFDKRKFYERYGVKEYYLYDPDGGSLEIWQTNGRALGSVVFEGEWRSPLLGVTLKLEGDGSLSVYSPDGRRFLPPVEIVTLAEQERSRAEQEHARAEQEHARAEQEHARAEQEHARAERLAARLRELGMDPDALSA